MKRMISPARAVIASVLVAMAALPAQAQLTDALRSSKSATQKATQTQERINQLDDDRSDMVREFRTLLQQQDAAALYARQQERVVTSQGAELASLEEQLGRIEIIKGQMIPMMEDMIDALNKFYAWDLPFKDVTDTGINVRAGRYEILNGNAEKGVQPVLNRADVSPAEQYRLIIDAYQAEMEYGNTIDTYVDDITVGDQVKTVDVFRFGRVSLVYQTQDRSEVGRFNRETRAWERLDDKYKDDINRGIRIASKVEPGAVLTAPVTKLSAPQ